MNKSHFLKSWLLFTGIVLAITFLLYKLLLQTANAAEVPSLQRMLTTVYLFSIIQFLIIGYSMFRNKEKKVTPKRLYIFAVVVAAINAVMWSIFKFYI